MANLTIGDLEGTDKHFAEELTRVLLHAEPTGEEPLMAVLEYALRALVTNDIRPVLVSGEEPIWTVGGR